MREHIGFERPQFPGGRLVPTACVDGHHSERRGHILPAGAAARKLGQCLFSPLVGAAALGLPSTDRKPERLCIHLFGRLQYVTVVPDDAKHDVPRMVDERFAHVVPPRPQVRVLLLLGIDRRRRH
jgi:hypothetical protein